MGKKKNRNGVHPLQNAEQNVNIWENSYWYRHYLRMFELLALSRYKWHNLPDSVDERWLEMCLFRFGSVTFFEDDVTKSLMALQSANSGYMTVYGVPTQRQITGANGANFHRDIGDSVIVWNNYLRCGDFDELVLYAQQAAMYTMIANININVQSTPAIIMCDEKDKLSLQNLFLQYDGKMPLIKAMKTLQIDDLKVVNLEAPFIADKINIQKNKVINECFSYLGINNSNQDKKERQISEEVQGNYESVLIGRDVGLLSRKKGCEMVNEMFGTSIDVTFNERLEKLYEKIIDNGGVRDVEIYGDVGATD